MPNYTNCATKGSIFTVGHIPVEISRLCHYFLLNGGLIEGKVVDNKPRGSPIPSGGQEAGDQTQYYFKRASTDHL